MSAPAMASPHGSPSKPTQQGRPPVSWQEVARVSRRRAMAIDTEVPTVLLVSQVIERFTEVFGDGARPVDLDGWVRRTLRELVELDEKAGPRLVSDHAALMALLTGLATPVRSPALARERKTLLHLVATVIGGLQSQVVLAVATGDSAESIATRLRCAPIDVVRLEKEGLDRLQAHLDRNPQLNRQLKRASRQPPQARTFAPSWAG